MEISDDNVPIIKAALSAYAEDCLDAHKDRSGGPAGWALFHAAHQAWKAFHSISTARDAVHAGGSEGECPLAKEVEDFFCDDRGRAL